MYTRTHHTSAGPPIQCRSRNDNTIGKNGILYSDFILIIDYNIIYNRFYIGKDHSRIQFLFLRLSGLLVGLLMISLFCFLLYFLDFSWIFEQKSSKRIFITTLSTSQEFGWKVMIPKSSPSPLKPSPC